jgi:hypothetical protein
MDTARLVVGRLVRLAIDEPVTKVRDSALNSIGEAFNHHRLPPDLVEPLAAAMPTMERELLEHTHYILGATYHPQARLLIEPFLHHPDPKVREDARLAFLQGDLLLELGAVQAALEGDGLAAGDLVLTQYLEEVQVSELPAVGLGQARVEGLQHPGQPEHLQRLAQGGVHHAHRTVSSASSWPWPARSAPSVWVGMSEEEQAPAAVEEGRRTGVTALRLGVGLGAGDQDALDRAVGWVADSQGRRAGSLQPDVGVCPRAAGRGLVGVGLARRWSLAGSWSLPGRTRTRLACAGRAECRCSRNTRSGASARPPRPACAVRQRPVDWRPLAADQVRGDIASGP